ncbi:hypothetical protein QP938_09255 [Porticoccaceae bacterium LTM1]|nr:hypothetical protein QP938_09255 [Porticoccaceae bacterium LTM1]
MDRDNQAIITANFDIPMLMDAADDLVDDSFADELDIPILTQTVELPA